MHAHAPYVGQTVRPRCRRQGTPCNPRKVTGEGLDDVVERKLVTELADRVPQRLPVDVPLLEDVLPRAREDVGTFVDVALDAPVHTHSRQDEKHQRFGL